MHAFLNRRRVLALALVSASTAILAVGAAASASAGHGHGGFGHGHGGFGHCSPSITSQMFGSSMKACKNKAHRVKTYTLSINVTGDGTTDPAAGSHAYDAGTSVIVTATPATGSKLTEWSGAATGTTNPVTITMDGDKTLTATFAATWTEVPQTYDNPVLPGDHPDLNIYIEGDDFYLTGSNFHMMPALEILHSTDLLHWERISRVVNETSAALSGQTGPGQGTWGGFIVKTDSGYRVYFAIKATQYFSAASSLAGPWSEPTQVNPSFTYTPPDSGASPVLRGTGSDNSVFVDPDSGKTYMLTKNGLCKWDADHPNDFGINLVTEIDSATGMLLPETTIDMSFVNWDQSTGGCGEFSNADWSKWAEGPTMAKRGDWYYYFVSSHTACDGKMGVWASKKLVGSTPEDWTWLGYVMGGVNPYRGTQHSTAPFQIADGTWWVFAHSYDCTGVDSTAAQPGEWIGLAREGLLLQLTWVDTVVGAETIPVPSFGTETRDLPAPNLTPSGIPFLVPVTDDFSSSTIGPAWTSYGLSAAKYSVADRAGWLRIKPDADSTTWVVQKDALRSSAMVVKMEFTPKANGDAAGVRVGNGYWQDEQVLSAPTWIEGQGFLAGIFDLSMERVMENGADKIRFAFRSRNPVATGGSGSYTALAEPVVVRYSVAAPTGKTVWLKLVRNNHTATGWSSTDRINWTQVGGEINTLAMDDNYGMSGAWVGNQAGMFATNKSADFDLFTYRDGFTPIPAAATNLQYGTTVTSSTSAGSVLSFQNGQWAMYGSVDLGGGGVSSKAIELVASAAGEDGAVEIWLDPLAGGTRIATCAVPSTGAWETWNTVTCGLTATGTHEVYMKVTGGAGEVLRLASLRFVPGAKSSRGGHHRRLEHGHVRPDSDRHPRGLCEGDGRCG